jgi:hypothetical protein
VTQIPDQVRPERVEAYEALLARLSRLSVTKHHDAYGDVAWDADALRIDAGDPRFELSDVDAIGATAWYRAQPPARRAAMGLHRVTQFMKVGLQFENVLNRGLLRFAARQPDRSLEFRYAYHELIEECQHTLMFQEFVNRSGLDVDGLPHWARFLSSRIAALGARFPELFFLFVLAGEDPIDFTQRTALRRELHPLLQRIAQIHVTEEARHLCFARAFLRRHVPSLSPARRAALALAAPLVLAATAARMMRPSRDFVARFAVPREVLAEVFRPHSPHRRHVAQAFAKVRDLWVELDLVTPRTERLWRALGVWA